ETRAVLRGSGVGGRSGEMGRNLVGHPGSQVNAVFDDPVVGWKGAHQSLQVREFEDEGIILAAVNLPPALVARSLPMDGDDLGAVMDDYNRMVTAGTLVEDHGVGRVRAMGAEGVLATYRMTEADADAVARATLVLGDALP